MTRNEERIPVLSARTLGPVQFLDQGEVQQIVERTGLHLRSGFKLEALESHLNQLINDTLIEMLFRPYEREVFEALRSHFQEYERLSREYVLSDHAPPRPPKQWYEETNQWMQEMEQLFAKRSRGGAPAKIQVTYLFPRALGLYASAFQARPRTTTGEGGRGDGPTARFLRELLSQIHKVLACATFGDEYSADEVRKYRNFKTTDDALRMAIKRAMQELSPPEDRTPLPLRRPISSWPVDKMWGGCAAFYDTLEPRPK